MLLLVGVVAAVADIGRDGAPSLPPADAAGLMVGTAGFNFVGTRDGRPSAESFFVAAEVVAGG